MCFARVQKRSCQPTTRIDDVIVQAEAENARRADVIRHETKPLNSTVVSLPRDVYCVTIDFYIYLYFAKK